MSPLTIDLLGCYMITLFLLPCSTNTLRMHDTDIFFATLFVYVIEVKYSTISNEVQEVYHVSNLFLFTMSTGSSEFDVKGL